jgi:hypothetical protein
MVWEETKNKSENVEKMACTAAVHAIFRIPVYGLIKEDAFYGSLQCSYRN